MFFDETGMAFHGRFREIGVNSMAFMDVTGGSIC